MVSAAATVDQVSGALQASGQSVDVSSVAQVAATLDTVTQLLASLNVDIPLVSSFLDAIGRIATQEIVILGIRFASLEELIAAFSNVATVIDAIKTSASA